MTLKLVLLSVLLVWNLVILSVYGLDKHKAIQHKRRISEKSLYCRLLSLVGIGAFLGGDYLDIKLTNGTLSSAGFQGLL